MFKSEFRAECIVDGERVAGEVVKLLPDNSARVVLEDGRPVTVARADILKLERFAMFLNPATGRIGVTRRVIKL